MSLLELVFLAIALAMDCVAVSIAVAAKIKSYHFKYTVAMPSVFGILQGIMPLIGFFIGAMFASYIAKFEHYIILAILGFLGAKMIFEAITHDEKDDPDHNLSYKEIFMLGIATSIDALAIGLTFALLGINLLVACSLIAVITAILSFFGIVAGIKLGTLLESKAEIFGGVVLIIIGLKVFAQGIGIF